MQSDCKMYSVYIGVWLLVPLSPTEHSDHFCSHTIIYKHFCRFSDESAICCPIFGQVRSFVVSKTKQPIYQLSAFTECLLNSLIVVITCRALSCVSLTQSAYRLSLAISMAFNMPMTKAALLHVPFTGNFTANITRNHEFSVWYTNELPFEGKLKILSLIDCVRKKLDN